MDHQRLVDDRLDAHPRIERRVGILEDHLHVPPRLAQRPPVEREHVLALNATWPDVGSIRRRMQRPVVVLPLPDSPTRPNVSPCSTENDTRSIARISETRPNEAVPLAVDLGEVADVQERHGRSDGGRRSGCGGFADPVMQEAADGLTAFRAGHQRGQVGAWLEPVGAARGAKAQPAGMWPSRGTVPSIARSRVPSRPGSDASRPRV